MRTRRAGALAVATVAWGCGPIVADNADATGGGSADGGTAGMTPGSSTLDAGGDAGESVGSTGVDRLDLGPGETGGDPGLDCNAFDPSRVYLFGTLAEGSSGRNVLADPTEPSEVCAGFLGYPWSPRVRSDGSVVFFDGLDGAGVYAFVPDALSGNDDGFWNYPSDPYGNDTLLLETPCESNGFLDKLLVGPDGGPAYVSCRLDIGTPEEVSITWFDADGVLFHEGRDVFGVAIDAAGRLAYWGWETGELRFVRPGELPSEPITLPRAVQGIAAGRSHGDGLWLVGVDYPSLWQWDLVDDQVVDEHQYSAFEAPIDSVYEGSLDGDGTFYSLAMQLDRSTADLIVRRPLAPGRAEVIYDEDDLPPDAIVKVHISRLFTGP